VVGVDHAGTRVAVGPNGEVYCVFQGDVTSGGDGQGPGTQKISRSVDFGATFSPPVVAAQVIESWPSAPPGANREEESVEYPSIAVDRSNGPNRGRVYITWHDAVLRDFSGALVALSEGPEPNNSPQDAQILAPPPPSNYGWSIGGTLGWNDFADWYRFTGQAGDHMRMLLNPGASNLELRVTLRCGSGAGTGTDTTLAASHRMPGSQVFFLFTLPTDGNYYVNISRIGSPTGSYQAYLRRAAGTLPSAAIDHRDVVLVSSPDGVSNWSNKVRVNHDTGFTDQAFPEVVVDGDGGVHVSWYDRRWDPHCRALADVALASSFDGGATFTTSERVTTGSSWWQVSADAIPNFGDQFRPTLVGHRLHMVWADGRRGDPDVNFAPLSTGFDVAMPPDARAVPGQGWDVVGTVRNTTVHDGALFFVTVDSETPALPDSFFVVGPVSAGGDAALVFDPIVGNGFQGPAPVHFQVYCNRSAQVQSATVIAYNESVPVWLQDFMARAEADGVRLEWRASGGTAFEVQRAVVAAGPFETLAAAPLRANGRDDWWFLDSSAGVGGVWFYRLVAVDADGRRHVFGPYRVETALPPRVALSGAVPNPFNPSTEIRFTLPRETAVTLRILDARGRRVATPLDAEPRKAGVHAVPWDGRDAHGVAQASGVYWAELIAGAERATSRLVLVR
jgi:hypothetical protein